MEIVEMAAALHESLAGSLVHTMLQSSAFCLAIFIMVLAIIHYNMKSDPVAPVISVALFCAGTIDGFQVLVVDHLVPILGERRNLTSFIWMASQSFNALILIVGVAVFLWRGAKKDKPSLGFVITVCLLFGWRR